MGICHREKGKSVRGERLAFLMNFTLHLGNELFKTMVSLVDLARQIREISVQVDFRAGKLSMATIAAHVKQLHPAFLEFG
jgi:hypothetical protein